MHSCIKYLAVLFTFVFSYGSSTPFFKESIFLGEMQKRVIIDGTIMGNDKLIQGRYYHTVGNYITFGTGVDYLKDDKIKNIMIPLSFRYNLYHRLDVNTEIKFVSSIFFRKAYKQYGA